MPLCTRLDPRGTFITEDGFSSLGLHDAALSCSSLYFTAKLSRSPSLGLYPSCDLHILELLRLGHGTCSFLLKWPRTVGISWINELRISAASLWRTKAEKTWFPLSGTPRFLPGSNLRLPLAPPSPPLPGQSAIELLHQCVPVHPCCTAQPWVESQSSLWWFCLIVATQGWRVQSLSTLSSDRRCRWS